jgi:hypothetical protein
VIILRFEDIDARDRFFNTKILEEHGVNEDTMETSTDCMLDVAYVEVLDEAKKHGAEIFRTCGFKTMEGCKEYENSCGSPCSYCQVMLQP